MVDVDGFVSGFLRQKALGEQARADIMGQIKSRLDDMILDSLETESALDEYQFLLDGGDENKLRAFLVAAIPDLDGREQQILDDFRSSYSG
jgi:hypothetical protein